MQVYTASGSAKDVRLTVQKLNLRRQEPEPGLDQEYQEELEGLRREGKLHASETEGPHSKQSRSSWQDFVEVSAQKPMHL